MKQASIIISGTFLAKAYACLSDDGKSILSIEDIYDTLEENDIQLEDVIEIFEEDEE